AEEERVWNSCLPLAERGAVGAATSRDPGDSHSLGLRSLDGIPFTSIGRATIPVELAQPAKRHQHPPRESSFFSRGRTVAPKGGRRRGRVLNVIVPIAHSVIGWDLRTHLTVCEDMSELSIRLSISRLCGQHLRLLCAGGNCEVKDPWAHYQCLGCWLCPRDVAAGLVRSRRSGDLWC